MKKLQVYASDTHGAWNILGEYAALYGDNGGEPDGDAWLPSDQDDIPTELAQKVVDAGYGEMVEVRMANDEAMINFLGLNPPADPDDIDSDYAERMRDRANEKQLAWAHYGAYGAMDSHWVFVNPEE